MKKQLAKLLMLNCFIIILSVFLFSTCSSAYTGNPLLLNSDVNLTNKFEQGFYCVNHGMHYHAKKFHVYETGTVDQLEKKIGINDYNGMLLSFVLGEANRAEDQDVKFEGKGSQEETIDGNNLRSYEPWQNYVWHLFGTSTGPEQYKQLSNPNESTYEGIEKKFEEYLKVWKQVIANGENPLNIIPVSLEGNDLSTYSVDPSGNVIKTDDVLVADSTNRVKFKVEYPWAQELNEYYGNIFKDDKNIPGLLNIIEIKVIINGTEFYDSTYNTNVVNKLQNAAGEAFKIGDKEAYIDVSELNYGEEASIKIEWNFVNYGLAQYSKLTPYRELIVKYQCTKGGEYEEEISNYKINGVWQIPIKEKITYPHKHRVIVDYEEVPLGNFSYKKPIYGYVDCDSNLLTKVGEPEYNIKTGEKGGEYQDIIYMTGPMNIEKREKELKVFIGQPSLKIKLNKIDALILNKVIGAKFEVKVQNGNIVLADGSLQNNYVITTDEQDTELEIKPDNTKGLVDRITIAFNEFELLDETAYLIYHNDLEVTFIWDSSTAEWKCESVAAPEYDNNVKETAEIEDIEKNSWRLTAQNRPKIEELSGYVWIDGVTGEKNIQGPNGLHDKSEGYKAGVKVYLYKSDGTQVEYDGYGERFGPGGEGYVITGNDGKFEFRNLPKLPAGQSYYVAFEYDGINYIATLLGGDSKAAEVDRIGYNARFITISAGRSNDGTELKYDYDGKASKLITENRNGTVREEFAIEANTVVAGYTYNETATDINLGISKKVVDLALMTDLYQATATINGIESTPVKYNTKFDDDMNAILDVMQNKTSDGVNYNINLYRSDYNYRIGNYINSPSISHQPSLDSSEQGALQDSREELKVILEYRVILANQSSTNASVDEFEFYYDSHLKVSNVTGGIVLSDDGNKLIIIPNTPNVGYGEYREVKLQFELKELSEEQVVKNYAEITKYSTTEGGYVDCDSAPGNANVGGALQYEDDTDEARGVNIRVLRTDREISGNVFEDNKVKAEEAQSYVTGNGVYDAGENKIDDVIVQLIEIKNLEIAGVKHRLEYIWQETNSGSNVVKKISDDGMQIETVQYQDVKPENGKYVFRGFIPGDYIVRFIYGDGTYYDIAINKNNILKYNGQDYKSTVDKKYASTYLATSSYGNDESSMARDIESRRLEVMSYALGVTDGNDLIIDSKEKLENTWMAADTSIIIVKESIIEKGVDTFRAKANFGLVERPATKLTLKKHIEYAELKDATGSTIVQAGVDVNSQYRDDSVEIKDFRATIENAPIEATATTRDNRGYWQVESNSVEGAKLTLKYKYIVENRGEPDYLGAQLASISNGKFVSDANYENDMKEYRDAIDNYAIAVKRAVKDNTYDIENSYLGKAYYSGTKGATDTEVRTYVSIEDYLSDLSLDPTTTDFELKGNEKKNIINISRNEVVEDVKVIRTKNGESVTANDRAEFDITTTTKIASKMTFPSYIAQIVTPVTSLSGTKITGSSPNNLEYVQSYYSVARLTDLGLGKGTEEDEFWAETFRIVPTTGEDKQSSSALVIAITIGLTIVAVGAVAVKNFLKK